MDSRNVRGISQPSTWHVGVVLFHYFMRRLFPFPWQYQSYTTLSMCAWIRLRIFSFSLQFLLSSLFFSLIPSFFSSVRLLSSLSLVQAVPSSFYPPCFSSLSSNYPSLSFVISTIYLCLHNKHGIYEHGTLRHFTPLSYCSTDLEPRVGGDGLHTLCCRSLWFGDSYSKSTLKSPFNWFDRDIGAYRVRECHCSEAFVTSRCVFVSAYRFNIYSDVPLKICAEIYTLKNSESCNP